MYIHAEDILAALALDGDLSDGTFIVENEPFGNGRGYRVFRVVSFSGYEVGIKSVARHGEPQPLELRNGYAARVGVWEHKGEWVVDEVVHVESPRLAHDLGRSFDQISVWNWFTEEVETIDYGV